MRVESNWLRRMGPAHFEHIDFRGTMRFGIERLVQSLIDDTPARRAICDWQPDLKSPKAWCTTT